MFLSKEELEKLNTKRLLAYKKMLLEYPEHGGDPNDSWGCNRIGKSSYSWKSTYEEVRAILATREHVEK